MRDFGADSISVIRARAAALAASWLDGEAGAPQDLLRVENLATEPTEPVPCFCLGTFCWVGTPLPE
ncbi:hypothetical protein JMF97_09385 [Micromonospora fiedleri]|uniref:Uncharacterized protein n=2 Tax=Micromonospora TaxID=1873 RepID=A0ABS1UJ47_9ACTN|nr:MULTISPECIES: hypothetical protein [Micromonospora]MBL6276371.1 hypothetical protein [Micromonospora fiedleri]PMR57985.1 hypothetical protein C1A38_27115 [Verrucosispora sp. ts21]WSK40457.1 hypothetical protein OG712_18135 [Micromonospora maris]GIJ15421.1 hypothetical protein Vgi01_21050 [Micromonospora gifhornensis]